MPFPPSELEYLRRLAEASPDAILTIDDEGHILFANGSLGELLGHEPADLVGQPLTLLIPERLRARHLRGFSRYLTTGERRLPWRAVEFPALHKDGREVPLEISFTEIREGDRRLFTGVLRDLTERAQAEEERARLLVREREARRASEVARGRLAFLAEAAGVLASSLDSEATLLTVGRLAVPDLADWCVVEVEADGHRPRRVVVVHDDPERAEPARALARRLTESPAAWVAASRVRQTHRAELYPVVPEALLRNLSGDGADRQLLLALGLVSAAIVPMQARGWLVGVLTLAAADPARRFGPGDLEVAEDFATRAAAALDNARLYEAGLDALEARDTAVSDLLALARQQAAVAELGRRALGAQGARVLRDEACSLVAQALGVDCCGIFELDPSGDAAKLVAGMGWSEGSVGGTVTGAANPLVGGEPGAVEDVRQDPRFERCTLVLGQGLVSLATAAIPRREGPSGTLAAFGRSPRTFMASDLHFLQAAAGLLGTAAERETATFALRASEERFRALIENASDGIALMEAGGVVLYAGPSTSRVLGYASEELVGRNGLDLVHPDDVDATRRTLGDLERQPKASVRMEYRVRHKDADWRWVEAVATNLLDEPSVHAVVSNYRDITERKRAEEEIRFRAHHDPLTDLPNRILFGDRLAQALAQAHRSGHGFAVLYIDLDNLKQVNDTLGHAAGDRLLRALAERLRACVRETDTVARVGGDEFTVILGEVGRSEDVARMAHKILATVGRPFALDGRPAQVTASIGAAVYPLDGVEADTLLKNADNALYRAKEAGRNTYALCTPEMNQLALERLRLERGLREALEREQLRLYYQPEIDAASGRLVGVEALLRWQHPEMGLLPAAAFVPLAESTRLILPIGEWALETAFRQVKAWQEDGLGSLHVAVNLSAVQFQQRHLARLVGRILRETGPDPRGIEFEITESAAMRDTESARRLLGDLRELGVGIAIDDFGTGYSSLAALKRFPIQTLKIDQAFVADLAVSADDAMLVRAIITMAHALRLKVVAEGVETSEQLAFLKRERCDAVQGYLLGRPVPPESITRVH